MKRKNKFNAGFLACLILTALYFVCYAGIVTLTKMNYSIPLMNGKLDISSCNGVIVSVQMLICTIMTVFLPKRSGGTIALLLPAFSISSMAFFMFRSGNPGAIPGICMLFVCLISISCIRQQIFKREKDALTDHLTGTHNRRSIMRNLEKMVNCEKPFSLLYIDIDEFKFINDNYGHKAGDKVIKTIADRIYNLIDSKCIFGRIGGDEFIILVPGQNTVSDTAKKVHNIIKEEISYDETGTTHYITASIGIARFPEDAKTSEELIKASDIAMYNAKTSGKNRIQYFEKAFETEMLRNAQIESMVRQYLSEESFTFTYQPQYCSKNKKLRGFETLIRVREEDRKIISTSELITVAEKSDLIFRIDEYVMHKALAEFNPIVKEFPDLTLSINISAKHISRKGFVSIMKKALDETGFPPSSLEIEITEYCLAGSVDLTIENMNKLRDLGIQFALDDFGTGYASLSYLTKLPVNLLKIDKSFIDYLENDKNAESSCDFISAVISMGHILGCEVISEGVESPKQLSILKEKKCDYIQGFLWGTPLDLNMAKKLCCDQFIQ